MAHNSHLLDCGRSVTKDNGNDDNGDDDHDDYDDHDDDDDDNYKKSNWFNF